MSRNSSLKQFYVARGGKSRSVEQLSMRRRIFLFICGVWSTRNSPISVRP